ncbi:unnamed protein product [Paramecium sonneborni]|uniref:Protein kinase domain-containing protein n=1 Tax=Paramecium sonneborni TaxID=65129 RepID=A0A8S1QHC5_9CILI|nr:unnamed protein product [Paramecium sonneborni]
MGQVQQSKKQFLKNWQKLDQYQSKIFGNVIEVYQDQQEQVAVIHKLFQNDEQYQNELKELQSYQQLSNIPGLIRLLEIHKQEEKYLCSNFYKIDAIYEYGDQFTFQIPLYQFIQQVMHTLIELQNRNKYHGDLIPSSFIFKNQVKVFLPRVNHYTRLLNGNQEDCYLSPELLEYLGRRSYHFQYHKEKSEIFSIGLITLELILQQSIQKIYNFSTYQINKDILNNFLQRADNKLISKMLELQPDKRPNYLSIYEESLVEMMQQSAIKIEYQEQIQINQISNQQFQDILSIHQSKILHIETQAVQSINNFNQTNPTQRSVSNLMDNRRIKSISQSKQNPKKKVKKVHPQIIERSPRNIIKINSKKQSSHLFNLEQLKQPETNINKLNQNTNINLSQVQQFNSSLQQNDPLLSPNNRYSYKKSHQSSAIKHQSVQQNEYAFLHDQIHVPFNPGSNFLDFSSQQEIFEIKTPNIQRQTSKFKDISKKQPQISLQNMKHNYKESIQRKPDLLKSQRPSPKSPIEQRIQGKYYKKM